MSSSNISSIVSRDDDEKIIIIPYTRDTEISVQVIPYEDGTGHRLILPCGTTIDTQIGKKLKFQFEKGSNESQSQNEGGGENEGGRRKDSACCFSMNEILNSLPKLTNSSPDSSTVEKGKTLGWHIQDEAGEMKCYVKKLQVLEYEGDDEGSSDDDEGNDHDDGNKGLNKVD